MNVAKFAKLYLAACTLRGRPATLFGIRESTLCNSDNIHQIYIPLLSASLPLTVAVRSGSSVRLFCCTCAFDSASRILHIGPPEHSLEITFSPFAIRITVTSSFHPAHTVNPADYIQRGFLPGHRGSRWLVVDSILLPAPPRQLQRPPCRTLA